MKCDCCMVIIACSRLFQVLRLAYSAPNALPQRPNPVAHGRWHLASDGAASGESSVPARSRRALAGHAWTWQTAMPHSQPRHQMQRCRRLRKAQLRRQQSPCRKQWRPAPLLQPRHHRSRACTTALSHNPAPRLHQAALAARRATAAAAAETARAAGPTAQRPRQRCTAPSMPPWRLCMLERAARTPATLQNSCRHCRALAHHLASVTVRRAPQQHRRPLVPSLPATARSASDGVIHTQPRARTAAQMRQAASAHTPRQMRRRRLDLSLSLHSRRFGRQRRRHLCLPRYWRQRPLAAHTAHGCVTSDDVQLHRNCLISAMWILLQSYRTRGIVRSKLCIGLCRKLAVYLAGAFARHASKVPAFAARQPPEPVRQPFAGEFRVPAVPRCLLCRPSRDPGGS